MHHGVDCWICIQFSTKQMCACSHSHLIFLRKKVAKKIHEKKRVFKAIPIYLHILLKCTLDLPEWAEDTVCRIHLCRECQKNCRSLKQIKKISIRKSLLIFLTTNGKITWIWSPTYQISILWASHKKSIRSSSFYLSNLQQMLVVLLICKSTTF